MPVCLVCQSGTLDTTTTTAASAPVNVERRHVTRSQTRSAGEYFCSDACRQEHVIRTTATAKHTEEMTRIAWLAKREARRLEMYTRMYEMHTNTLAS
jgi:hypothetical protein